MIIVNRTTLLAAPFVFFASACALFSGGGSSSSNGTAAADLNPNLSSTANDYIDGAAERYSRIKQTLAAGPVTAENLASIRGDASDCVSRVAPNDAEAGTVSYMPRDARGSTSDGILTVEQIHQACVGWVAQMDQQQASMSGCGYADLTIVACKTRGVVTGPWHAIFHEAFGYGSTPAICNVRDLDINITNVTSEECDSMPTTSEEIPGEHAAKVSEVCPDGVVTIDPNTQQDTSDYEVALRFRCHKRFGQ